MRPSHSEPQALEEATLGTTVTDSVSKNYNKREDGSKRVRIYVFINFHTYFNYLKFDMANDLRSSYGETYPDRLY